MRINKINILVTNIFIYTVKLYRLIISPIFGSTCRFYPSCSEYFIQSIKYRGIFKGSIIGIIRITRCNPFNPGGDDPIRQR